jgi:hypothetical protein
MCSIEEAWAGQTFDGYKVQSQADLRRKYMPISDDILTRNNEFSVSRKEPVSRMANQGINTKMVRPMQIAASTGMNPATGMDISFSSNQAPMDNYGGLEPRPGYMSIYDNSAEQGLPMPTQTQAQAGRSAFGDINQAFQVSPTVERFMARGGSDSNPLMNDNTEEDQLILYKKLNPSARARNNNSNNTTMDLQAQITQIHTSLKDILARLENVESELESGGTRNMYDMALYILVGILIAFIFYSLLRK